MTRVLIVTDKCIKEEEEEDGNVTQIARRDIRENICSVVGRQSITFLKEYFLHQLGTVLKFCMYFPLGTPLIF